MQLLLDSTELTADGCLKVVAGMIFNTYVIDPWARGMQAYRLSCGQPQPSSMWTVPLIVADVRPEVSPALYRFCHAIPDSVRCAVRRFEFGQVMLLRLAAQAPETRDLLTSNSLLLWLLMLAVYEGRIEFEHLPDYCRWRQRRLLATIGGPAAVSAQSLLQKIELEDGTLGEAELIKSAIEDPEIVEEVRHLPMIPVTLLAILVQHPRLVGKGLVRLLANQPVRGHAAAVKYGFEVDGLLAGLEQLGRHLAIDQPHRALRDCRSLEAARALRRRWAVRARQRGLITRTQLEGYESRTRAAPVASRAHAISFPSIPRRDETLPPPPLSDSPDIIALRTLEDIAEEGFVQRHCLTSRTRSVRTGQAYIYKVLAPQRGTLEILMVDGRPAIGLFKLSCNREPGERAWRAVRKWFAAGLSVTSESR
jgi:hypothetical protein